MTTRTMRLSEHLGRLAESLRSLKDRAQDAVAGELARAVGQTAQDVIHSALGRTPATPPAYSRREYDPWAYEDAEPGEFDSFDPPPLPAMATTPPPTRARPAWLPIAGRALIGCLTRPTRPWWPLALLAGAGVAALAQHPLVVAISVALQTAAELLGA